MVFKVRRRSIRNIYIISAFFFATYIIYNIFDVPNVEIRKEKYNSDNEYNNEYFPDSNARVTGKKIDWHDYVQIELELGRKGIGEQGLPAEITDNILTTEKQSLWDTNGFNALLSDRIALDRSLKDIRHPKCSSKKYNSELPTVSVVIPFFEEHWTTLLRTVVSLVLRSPKKLLKEIILVDDGSSMKKFLKDPLDKWMKKNQPLVKIIRLPERVGLIIARQEGAKVASADVIVVLDSHCEVMVGWLPPLLEPIVEDPHTAVCPLIDVINADNFAYYPQDNGARGAFDWRFYYKRLPLPSEDEKNLPEPFKNPVMNGGLFAINRKFFWQLGGYDEGLKIWGGEQYNLSFKIWLCGGRLLDSPCSRVGHVFRQGGKKRPAAKNAGNFISVNYKRVAMVWMDDYADAIYRRSPKMRNLDAGDISNELKIKEKLHCKPFKWFLDEVAPDLTLNYPPVEPPDYANGYIKSDADPTLCIDTGSKEQGDLILYNCHGYGPQYFSLNWRHTIRIQSEQFCWGAPVQKGAAPVLQHCSNQKETSNIHSWRYDPETKLIQEKEFRRCLQALPSYKTLAMQPCDSSAISQKWTFKYVNVNRINEKYPPFS